MSNPYHDENGKFSSREKMLSAIDSLAVSGRVDEYLVMRKEFDLIEKDRVLVPKDFFATAVRKANIPEAEVEKALGLGGSMSKNELSEAQTNFYRNLSSGTRYEIITDLAWRMDSQGQDNTAEILDILKASDYDSESMYGAIYNIGLPYPVKAKLVNEHDLSSYGVLAERHGDQVWAEDKQGLFKAIEAELNAPLSQSILSHPDKHESDLDKMVSLVATHATDEDDLNFAIRNNAYGGTGLYGHAVNALAGNPNLTKPQMLELATRELNSGGENYWSIRHEAGKTLAARGEAVLPEYEGATKFSPLSGPTPQELTDLIEATPINERRKDWLIPERDAASSARVVNDAHEANYNELLKEAKTLTKTIKSWRVSEADLKVASHSMSQVKRRLDTANQLLSHHQDFEKFKEFLLKP